MRRLAKFNDSGALLAVSYVLALYGLFGQFHFAVNREFWERLMDFAHIPLFFALAVVTVNAPIFPKQMGRGWRLAITALFLTAFAGATEIIQPYFNRTKDIIDFRNGVFATVVGLAGVEVWRRPGHALRLLYLALVIAGSSYALHPAFAEFQGIVWRRLQFPLLAGFESPSEMLAWHPSDGAEISRSHSNVAAGDWSLHLLFQNRTLSGAEFFLSQCDWRGFAVLKFDAYNPGAPFTLILRVDDDGPHGTVGDRAHWTALLGSGWNHVTIPLSELEHAPKSRVLNLSAIRRMVFFTETRAEKHEMFLDSVRLAK